VVSLSSCGDETSVEEDVEGESGEGHQWTTGGVRGGRRLNIGREEVEDFLDGAGWRCLEAVDAGFRSEFERE
jgi:hypothetical protein